MTMKFNMGALADRVNGEQWEVYCAHCLRSVGRMTSEQVQYAIFATMGRGGVLCPTCRLRTCDLCGRTYDWTMGHINIAGAKQPDTSCCAPCRDNLTECGMDWSYVRS